MVGSQMDADKRVLQNLNLLVQPEPWQQSQWEKMADLGLPKAQDEAWKYTPLSTFKKLSFQKVSFCCEDDISYESLSLNFDSYRLIFLDGNFLVRCSDWIPKVRVTLLSELSDIESYEMMKAVRPESFSYLMDATATSGTWLEVEPNTIVNKPIYLLHISSGLEGDVCSYRHHIHVGHSSQCEVIEHHISLTQGGGVTFSRLTAQVEEEAHYYHTKLVKSHLNSTISPITIW